MSGKKSCQEKVELFIVNCIFASIQVFSTILCPKKSAPLNMSEFLQKCRTLFNYHLTVYISI